jgi:hypothetical protein
MPSFFNMSWNELFKSCLPLSVRTQIGLLREYLAMIERSTEATAVPVFDLSGTMFRNLEKTSITEIRYLSITFTEILDVHEITFTDVHDIRDIRIYGEFFTHRAV